MTRRPGLLLSAFTRVRLIEVELPIRQRAIHEWFLPVVSTFKNAISNPAEYHVHLDTRFLDLLHQGQCEWAHFSVAVVRRCTVPSGIGHQYSDAIDISTRKTGTGPRIPTPASCSPNRAFERVVAARVQDDEAEAARTLDFFQDQVQPYGLIIRVNILLESYVCRQNIGAATDFHPMTGEVNQRPIGVQGFLAERS